MKKEFREMLKERGRDSLPNVLLVSAECAPLSKTGGLADVVGTLPKSLAALGVDARVITPYHRVIKNKYADKVEHMFYFYAQLGWRREYVGIEKLVLDGVTVYLVDNERYFGDSIYRGGNAELEQYAFFTRAVLDAIPNLDFAPDVIHCNDWHTAMIPMLGKTQYSGGMQEHLRYLLTIHNIAFQGKCGFDQMQDLLSVDPKYYTSEFVELNGCANFLKAGCVFADRINTVSPSYAREIMMPYYAEGLDGILNARSAELSGIINGIDKTVFNPNTDKRIPAHFNKGHLKGKATCKTALQERLGLEQHADVPIFAMVTRMTEQKGFDLVVCDGFSGNVLVKSVEGTAMLLMKKIKNDIYSRRRYKIGAFFMKQMFKEEKEFMNYQNYGGSVMLGTEKIVVKGHGSSDRKAVYKCIAQAYRMEKSGLNKKISKSIAESCIDDTDS